MRTLIVASGILALTGSAGAMAGHRVASQDPLGSPAETGLVVVEVRFERSKAHKLFGWGADDVRGYLVWLGDEPRVFEGKESKDLIIFSGLQPGPYRLDGITAAMRSGNLLQARMPADDARFSVDVKAGTAAYLGKVTIVDRDFMFRIGRPPAPETSIENDAALAAEAWKRFLAAHAKTAWAARVREQLAGTATAASETPAAASPLARIEALVREADEADSNRTVRNFLERRGADAAAAEQALAAHVESHPDDARAMFMGVRLAYLRQLTTPVVLGGAAGPVPPDTYAALAATMDRVIALQPDHAAAHFWKARIAGIEVPAIKNSVLTKDPRDLPQAVASARRAVELAPDNVLYRQTLATFLISDDKEREALEVIRSVVGADGAPHPITSIFAAWQALPVPDGAREQRQMARGWADLQVSGGRLTNYPYARTRAYVVPVRLREVEAFYKTHWKNFKLFEMERERDGTTGTTLYGQFLTWKNGRLEPSTSRRQVDRAYERGEDGLMLAFMEVTDLAEESRAPAEGITSGTYSELLFVNHVSMNFR